MRPIEFACRRRLSRDPAWIVDQVLDVDRWSAFRGWGPLPGIASARFRTREPGLVGTAIEVINRDGSRHVETITAYEPGRSLTMRLGDFGPPVSWLATHFVEAWTFSPGDGTEVVRAFELHPTNPCARPALYAISLALRRAVDRHLEDMARDAA